MHCTGAPQAVRNARSQARPVELGVRRLSFGMKKQYEAWHDAADNSITLALAEAIIEQQAQGILSRDAKLLYRIEADTWEEASAVHHIKMGWEPYAPMGEPRECPRGCGAMFYPEGSGECPNCGKIC